MKIELHYLTQDPQQQAICRDYWLRNDTDFLLTTRDVADKHDVQYQGLSKRIAEWCQAYSLEDGCSQCGEQFRVHRSRTEYLARVKQPSDWTCNACQRLNQEVAQRQREAQKETVRNFFDNYGKGMVCISADAVPSINTLEQVTALLGLIRLGATENLTHIRSVLEIGRKLWAPTEAYEAQLIHDLIGAGVLRPNVEHSPEQAFAFEDDEFHGEYYIFHVAWDYPLLVDSSTGDPVGDPAHLIRTLDGMFLRMDWPEPWYEQWVPLWQKIALNECLQYLDFCMTDHSFQFNPGEKTRQVLTNVLSTFSVAQAYNFIWGAARNAAAYYMRESIPKRQAANSVVGGIQRRADQARAEGWDVKSFRRDRRCPQTMISRVFFDTVLQIGEEGFCKPPSDS
jgi:hypothetical protein